MNRLIPKGPKIYFPSSIFTLVRSGIKRSPREVVFRVPRHLTKLDIQQYLEGLYGLTIRHVRTFNFLPRRSVTGRVVVPARKNAIITLKDAKFEYPSAPDPATLKNPLPPTNNWPTIH